MNLDKICQNSKKYNINRYADRIELFDKTSNEFVVSIPKKYIEENPWILKLI